MRVLVSLWLAATIACGGADRITARWPSQPGFDTGSVTIVLSRRASDVAVAVNGILVVDAEKGRRVRIEDVETGYADIAIAASGVDRQLRVWVEKDRDTAVPIGVEGPPPQNPVVTTILSVAALLISRGVTQWLF